MKKETSPVGLGTIKLIFPFELLHPDGYALGREIRIDIADNGFPLPTVSVDNLNLRPADEKEVRNKLQELLIQEWILRLVVVSTT